MITVVGIGIEQGDLTIKGKNAIKKASYVFSRTRNRYATAIATELFPDCNSFEALNEKICAHLLEKSKSECVVYLVAGDGYGDGVVQLLQSIEQVEIVSGVADNRGRMAGNSIAYYSAYDVDESTFFNTAISHIIYQIDDDMVAGNVKLALLNYYDAQTQVVLSDKKKSVKIALEEMDRMKSYDCACLYIPSRADFLEKKRFEINDLIRILRRLTAPDGCPWDKVQTHESIRVNMIEEAYEAIEAIDNGDIDNMIEELGDVLLQVVFHCDMSERAYEFNFNDVVSGVCEKLVSRHTHIFGQDKASDPEGALQAWDNAKAKEKHAHSFTEQIERLPVTFPATFNIQKVIKKANKNGATVTKEQAKEKLLCAIREDDVEKIAFYSVVYSTLCGRDPEVDLAKSASELKRVSEQLDKDGKLDKLSENI